MVAHRGRANMIEQMFEMAHRVRFVESECKSALTRVQGMPFQWSLNPYRGCSHACPSCYARSYHCRMDRDPGAGFDREIEVKTNFPAVLERALRRPRDGAVALGTATDPYQPCEGRYRVTRRALEALARRPLPLSIRGRGCLLRVRCGAVSRAAAAIRRPVCDSMTRPSGSAVRRS
jgi:DNA repair photolyase